MSPADHDAASGCTKEPVPVCTVIIAGTPAAGSPAFPTESAINELVVEEHFGDLLKLPILADGARVLSDNVMSAL